MFPGRSRRLRPASTFCARSRSRLTSKKRGSSSTRATAPANWSPKPSWCGSIPNGAARASLSRDGTIGETRAIQTFFSYRLLDPDNVRNRPPGGGGLYDIGCYAILTARYIFGAEPTRVVATIDWDPKFKTDRLASALLEFPGGRQLTFTVGTQLSAHQRVTIVGDAGRIEVMIPFNAPIDRPTEIAIDTGADLDRRRPRGSRNSPSATSTRCRATPSRPRLWTRRSSSSRSRTRSPTCASSTPCSAPPRAGPGRSREARSSRGATRLVLNDRSRSFSSPCIGKPQPAPWPDPLRRVPK